MKTVLKILIFYFFIVSCNDNDGKYKYEISDFREELRPFLKSLSKEKSLPLQDTVARNFIEKNATKEELIKLMHSKNPLLRVIAYRTIVNRQEPEYFDLLIGHLSDTARVQCWVYDDVLEYQQVSEIMIRKAFHKNGLSPIHKNFLVEKVLLEHSYLDISTWMIEDVEPNEKYYTLIKQRAELKEGFWDEQLPACFALSKFKKKDDVDLLYSVFDENLEKGRGVFWIFRSIEKFPYEKFYPLLENYFAKNVKGKLSSEKNISDAILYFTRAVSAYKNENSLSILKYIEQNNTYINKPYWPPSNKEYVYKAMLINYDTIYDDFIKKIRKEFKKEQLLEIGFGPKLLEYDERPDW